MTYLAKAGAEIAGNLWEYNMAKVVVIDVSEDYRLLQAPMPNGFYPVLGELWFPRHNLPRTLAKAPLVQGYLYDWHETGDSDSDSWYVGVVAAELAAAKA
jgi:hypothetical protein